MNILEVHINVLKIMIRRHAQLLGDRSGSSTSRRLHSHPDSRAVMSHNSPSRLVHESGHTANHMLSQKVLSRFA